MRLPRPAAETTSPRVVIFLVPFIFLLRRAMGRGCGLALEGGGTTRTMLHVLSTITHGRGAVITANRQTVYQLAIKSS
jgi:hypothetical protein